MLTYKEPEPISKEAVHEGLARSESEACEALIRAACTINDTKWVESVLVSALSDERLAVRKAAIVGLGDLVRIQHQINLDLVIPLIGKLLPDPLLGGTAEDTLAEIAMFYKPEKP